MKIGSILLLSTIILLAYCKSNSSTPVITERDISITQANAFSELFLDSTKLENFIETESITDSAAAMLRNFYNSRNYAFAWFTNDGLAEQGRAFWNLHNNYIHLTNDSSFIDKRLHEQMELFMNEDTILPAISDQLAETELRLTGHFFEYAQYAYAGKINPRELQWHIPRKKVDAMALLDSLLANNGKNITQWEPVNPQYRLMAKELNRYYEIDKAGGWEEIEKGKKGSYKMGEAALVVKQVKKRLKALGDYHAADTSERFTDELIAAVKQAQKRFGHKQNGVIDTSLIKDLNVPLQDRIKKMLINMERMRWMPKDPQGKRLIANIPEFKLHVFESSTKVWEMDVVVGTAANKTVVFNDSVKSVVFSPYWNIPRSIVRNEILPAMRRNSNYLRRNNMEQTGYSNGLPVIRQKPGRNNSLGKVKFIFPNSYSIYFHDTPAKSLFNKQQRAFSHGCIRLAEPKRLAQYLLQEQPSWTSSKIDEAMNASKEKWVGLQEPVPVIITYFTAWVNHEGLLHFRDDIYGHDKKMAERLFNN